jgi:LacI family transcriptional regulator
VRLENDDVVQVIQRLKVPAVFLRQIKPTRKIACILTDNSAASQLGFEHLKERGFRRFAYCGFNGADYSDERRNAFVRLVTQAGFPCEVYDPFQESSKRNTAQSEALGFKDSRQVASWIKSLPKPVGVLACNDMRGQQVLDASRSAGVSVPEEIAVIGVDNDQVICDFSAPPLSSVIPNTERIGYEAAELLTQMMAGKKPPKQTLFIQPSGIATRRSTDVLAMEDQQIARAARFIREHACEGIDVSDILRAVPMSRSTLDRRFINILGRSPKEEILRVRLNRAKQLLTETDIPLSLIAEKIGLLYTEYFSRVFKKRFGVTPSEFRSSSRN